MQLKCACGKALNVPDKLAGKNAKCPACSRVFKVPSPRAPAKGGGPSASGEKIVVACACGKKLAAPAGAAGKKVRCPGCGAILDVPAPKAAAEPPPPADDDMDFELDISPSAAPADDDSGFELDASTPPAPPPPETDDHADEYVIQGLTCPNCGAKLEGGSQFCVNCGTHLGSGAKLEGVDLESVKESRSKNKTTVFIVGGAVAAVVLAIVVTVIVVKPKFDLSIIGLGSSSSDSGSSPAERPREPAPAPAPSQTSSSGGPSAANPAPPDGAPGVVTPPTEVAPPPDRQRLGVSKIKKEGFEGYLTLTLRAPTRARAKMAEIAGAEAVQAFQAEHDGRRPKSIEELESGGYKLQKLPDGLLYEYKPETGKIRVGSIKDR